MLKACAIIVYSDILFLCDRNSSLVDNMALVFLKHDDDENVVDEV